jgi:dsRNA-specific ribonuclease
MKKQKSLLQHISLVKFRTISKEPVKSYKTMVQEHLQKEYKELPVYKDTEHEVDEK